MSDAPRPSARLGRLVAYNVPAHPFPTDMRLSGNEGAHPPAALLAEALGADDDNTEADAGDGFTPRLYGRPADLEAALAARFEVDRERVIVTAGGDDTLYRAIFATCDAERALVLPVPTFEMLDRYATIAGAEVRRVPWPRGPYPLDAVRAAAGDDAGCVMVVAPNNPTGAAVDAVTLEALCEALPRTLVVVDQAYAEYDDGGDALTRAALSRRNTLLVRTFSKAWGLAGLRVGYAIAAPEVIGWLRAVGQPYAVSTASAHVALRALADGHWVAPHVERVRVERERLAETFTALGAAPRPTQANFVLADLRDRGQALWLADACASLGIAVRRFGEGGWGATADRDGDDGGVSLARSIRISCPGEEAGCARVLAAMTAALDPQALLLLPALASSAAQLSSDALRALGDHFAARGGGLTGAGVDHADHGASSTGGGDAGRGSNGASGAGAAALASDDAVIDALDALGCTRAWALCVTDDEIARARRCGLVPIAVLDADAASAPAAEREQLRRQRLRAGAARVLDRADDVLALLAYVASADDDGEPANAPAADES